MPLFRNEPAPAPAPVRPSHHGEDQNERVPRDAPDVDYAHGTDEPGIDFGWTVPPAEPTPVYLTEPPPSAGRNVRWNAATYTVDTAPILLAGANPFRVNLIIRNLAATGADEVILTRGQTDIASVGYRLRGASMIELVTTDAVWVRASAATRDVTVVDQWEVAST